MNLFEIRNVEYLGILAYFDMDIRMRVTTFISGNVVRVRLCYLIFFSKSADKEVIAYLGKPIEEYDPHPLFTVVYIMFMIGFSIYKVLSRNKGFDKKFKVVVALSLSLTGLSVILFFISAVVGVNFFNPQYTMPISGMIMGHVMTAILYQVSIKIDICAVTCMAVFCSLDYRYKTLYSK